MFSIQPYICTQWMYLSIEYIILYCPGKKNGVSVYLKRNYSNFFHDRSSDNFFAIFMIFFQFLSEIKIYGDILAPYELSKGRLVKYIQLANRKAQVSVLLVRGTCITSII